MTQSPQPESGAAPAAVPMGQSFIQAGEVPPAPKKKSLGRKILGVLGVIVVIVIIAVVKAVLRDSTTPEDPASKLVKGDCVVNAGTDSKPELKKAACGAKTFEVMAKITETTDPKTCEDPAKGVADPTQYNSTYVHDMSPGTRKDFVLCLKERTA